MTANRSGNRKTLFLTAGEIRTALGYKTIIGIRQFLYKFIRLSCMDSIDNVFSVRSLPPFSP